jgi:hypothetical protein
MQPVAGAEFVLVRRRADQPGGLVHVVSTEKLKIVDFGG